MGEKKAKMPLQSSKILALLELGSRMELNGEFFPCGSPGFGVPWPGPSRFISLPALRRAQSSFQNSGNCLHRWSSGQECEAKGEETQTFGCALQTSLSHSEQPERFEVCQIQTHQEQAFTACSVPEFLLLFTLVLIPTRVGVTEVRGQTKTFCLELFNLPSFIFPCQTTFKAARKNHQCFLKDSIRTSILGSRAHKTQPFAIIPSTTELKELRES